MLKVLEIEKILDKMKSSNELLELIQKVLALCLVVWRRLLWQLKVKNPASSLVSSLVLSSLILSFSISPPLLGFLSLPLLLLLCPCVSLPSWLIVAIPPVVQYQ